MIVHVVDGTYGLFRHFYGLRRFDKGKDRPFGAVIGALQTVLQMLEQGATHIGVATDRIIESSVGNAGIGSCSAAARSRSRLQRMSKRRFDGAELSLVAASSICRSHRRGNGIATRQRRA
jgi:hypothetical protein